MMADISTTQHTVCSDSRKVKKVHQRVMLALFGLASSVGTALASDNEQVEVGGPPQGFSAGAAVISSNPSYVGLKADILVVPFLGYEGKNYYFRGLSFGRYLLRSRQQQLSISINAEPFRFRPEESSDTAIQQLDKRNFSATIAVNYQYNTRYGSFSTNINTDIVDQHNGQRASISYSLPLNRPGQQWQIAPEISLNYTSKDYVRHYFGISEPEAARSGLAAYDGGHAFSPSIGVGGYYMFSENLSVIGNIRFIRSASAIANSPMVAARSARTVFTAISYRF